MVWYLVAPDPGSSHRPSFDATDPAQYPGRAWDRYDLIAREATALGMGVYFQIIPRVPVWAIPRGSPCRARISAEAPDPTPVPPVRRGGRPALQRQLHVSQTRLDARPPTLLGLPLGAAAARELITSTTDPAGQRVGDLERAERALVAQPWHRSLPHHRTEWLQPVHLPPAGRRRRTPALIATGHRRRHDPRSARPRTTASSIRSSFLRGLYCVDDSLRPLRGAAAATLRLPVERQPRRVRARPSRRCSRSAGTPTTRTCSTSRPTTTSPTRTSSRSPTSPTLERMLNRIFATYGRGRRGGVPLYADRVGLQERPAEPVQPHRAWPSRPAGSTRAST